jgi:hypothetical protein
MLTGEVGDESCLLQLATCLHSAELINLVVGCAANSLQFSTGEVGDESCLPELATCLHDQELNKAACDAMWAVFHRNPNPAVNRLMEQVCLLLCNTVM